MASKNIERLMYDYLFKLEEKELEKNKKTFQQFFRKVFKLINMNYISFLEFKNIYQIFRFAQQKDYLEVEFSQRIQQVLLNAEVICSDIDIEEFNQIKAEIQAESLEPTSGGRK